MKYFVASNDFWTHDYVFGARNRIFHGMIQFSNRTAFNFYCLNFYASWADS